MQAGRRTTKVGANGRQDGVGKTSKTRRATEPALAIWIRSHEHHTGPRPANAAIKRPHIRPYLTCMPPPSVRRQACQPGGRPHTTASTTSRGRGPDRPPASPLPHPRHPGQQPPRASPLRTLENAAPGSPNTLAYGIPQRIERKPPQTFRSGYSQPKLTATLQTCCSSRCPAGPSPGGPLPATPLTNSRAEWRSWDLPVPSRTGMVSMQYFRSDLTARPSPGPARLLGTLWTL